MKFQTVQTSKLIIDKRYQRELDQGRVNRMVEEFDPRRLGTLEVSKRGGKWAVFDGQHRLAALRKLKVANAPCIAHTGLTPQEEADLFVAHQRDRRNVSGLERFRARVFAGDEVAVAIKETVEGCGYGIPDYYSGEQGERRQIRAVSTLERIYNQGGERWLTRTLNKANIWNGDPKATDGLLIEGLFILLKQYRERVDADAERKLAEVAPTTIIRRATGNAAGGGGWTAKAVAVELRKIAGVRGRPSHRRPEKETASVA